MFKLNRNIRDSMMRMSQFSTQNSPAVKLQLQQQKNICESEPQQVKVDTSILNFLSQKSSIAVDRKTFHKPDL